MAFHNPLGIDRDNFIFTKGADFAPGSQFEIDPSCTTSAYGAPLWLADDPASAALDASFSKGYLVRTPDGKELKLFAMGTDGHLDSFLPDAPVAPEICYEVICTLNAMPDTPHATCIKGAAFARKLADFPTQALTFEMSFTSDELLGNESIPLVAFGTPSNPCAFVMHIHPLGHLHVVLGGAVKGGGAEFQSCLTVADLYDGARHDLSLTWDDETGMIALYLDGELADCGVLHTGLTVPTSGAFVIGNSLKATKSSGKVFHAALWDHTRTLDEINRAHDVEAMPDLGDPALLSCWTPDKTGKAMTDLKGRQVLACPG